MTKEEEEACHMRRRIYACQMRRRIHACHMRRIHACHMKRIHACHMRRWIHACPRLSSSKRPLRNNFEVLSASARARASVMRRRIHACCMRRRIHACHEEEDTCMSYEEDDTCLSYDEEDTCLLAHVQVSPSLASRDASVAGRAGPLYIMFVCVCVFV